MIRSVWLWTDRVLIKTSGAPADFTQKSHTKVDGGDRKDGEGGGGLL